VDDAQNATWSHLPGEQVSPEYARLCDLQAKNGDDLGVLMFATGLSAEEINALGGVR